MKILTQLPGAAAATTVPRQTADSTVLDPRWRSPPHTRGQSRNLAPRHGTLATMGSDLRRERHAQGDVRSASGARVRCIGATRHTGAVPTLQIGYAGNHNRRLGSHLSTFIRYGRQSWFRTVPMIDREPGLRPVHSACETHSRPRCGQRIGISRLSHARHSVAKSYG